MGTFDSFADSPFQIRTEGQEITLTFQRTGPTTGRISWNIPTPALGCSAENQAYNGIVITLDTVPASIQKVPVDGAVYTADPTADTNLHAGDKIETALVVGAFYDDKTTIFFDVSGLKENTPYYIAGYAVDAQLRYHRDGVHAYSLNYLGDNGQPDTAGYQVVTLGNGVVGTDATGLLFATLYEFLITVDGTEHLVTIDGTNAQTYDDLVAAINAQLAQVDNPQQSTLAPNTNAYFYDVTNEKLYQWNGTNHVEIPAIVEATDPTILPGNSFWYNPVTGELNRRDNPAPGWNLMTSILSYHIDPTQPTCDDYWFSGIDAYEWDGNVWCKKTLWNQSNDPSLPVYPPCGTYWYNSEDLTLYKWNDETTSWDAVNAIYWNANPNTLADGTYWYDEENEVLYLRSLGVWVQQAATISETEPSLPAPLMLWYDPINEELWQRDAGNTMWNTLAVLPWFEDPTDRESCDLWWDSVTDQLKIWDVTTSTWDVVTNFLQQAIDPAAAPTLTTDDVWFNTTDNKLYRWDGSEWLAVSFMTKATDPMVPVVDDIWFNTSTNEFNIWTGAAWSVLNVIESENNPEASFLPAGSFWYNTTANTLHQWNGLSWVAVAFTTVPLTPSLNELWFDTSTNTLKIWNGTEWVPADTIATVELNSDGHLLFTSGSTGSMSHVSLTDSDLFSLLVPIGIITDMVWGSDGVVEEQTYAQLGIGDDGSPDERRELMDSIRQQLGYPIVEVELTKYQLDTCVTAAIESIRKRSGNAYRRAFFFVDLQPGQQGYVLSNKRIGFNKIVSITQITRMSSAFLSTAYGAGAYGQVVLQHLYNMGTFDILSYDLVSQYIEQLEHIFASRIMFQWNEHSRRLDILQTIAAPEKVLVDAVIERTEQELLVDRFTKSWIEKYATAEARMMLSEIRGKYATLPGAGGGVALNAGELMAKAEADKADLYQQLDEFVVNNVEEWGMGTTFVIG